MESPKPITHMRLQGINPVTPMQAFPQLTKTRHYASNMSLQVLVSLAVVLPLTWACKPLRNCSRKAGSSCGKLLSSPQPFYITYSLLLLRPEGTRGPRIPHGLPWTHQQESRPCLQISRSVRNGQTCISVPTFHLSSQESEACFLLSFAKQKDRAACKGCFHICIHFD